MNKYTLLTFTDYYTFNQAVSEGKGYDISLLTQRLAPMTAQLAKVNIVGESYDLRCVAIVDDWVQENMSEAIAMFEYVDKEDIVYAYDEVLTLTLFGYETNQVDWNLIHQDANGSYLEIIYAQYEPYSEAAEPAVASLVAKGTTVITPEPDEMPVNPNINRVVIHSGFSVEVIEGTTVVFLQPLTQDMMVSYPLSGVQINEI